MGDKSLLPASARLAAQLQRNLKALEGSLAHRA